MEVSGICAVCGKACRACITCRLCGKTVCERHQRGGVCLDCIAGKKIK